MSQSSVTSPPGFVARALHALVSQIPTSAEPPSSAPAVRTHELARSAALKAATMSGSFTLPPGPLGMATVLPDLLGIWRIQQQLVADIAATFGRSAALTRETMLICLFKHGGAAITHRLLSRGDDDNVVVHRIANRALQQMLEKIGIRIGQRLAAKSAVRWLPIFGALGAGAYAYYDTTHVATNALELFSKPLLLANQPEPSTAASHARPQPRTAASRPSKTRKRSAARPRSKPASRSTSSKPAKPAKQGPKKPGRPGGGS